MRKLFGLSLRGLSGCIFVSAALTGCVLDFEKFPTAPISPGTDTQIDDTDLSDADAGVSDLGFDLADALPDLSGVVVDLGTSCQVDQECGVEKVCMGGFCTVLCGATTPCDDGICLANAGDFVCVPTCESACAVNTALGCVTGISPSGPETGCLPDEDGDGASDSQDNCPTQANPYQKDTDADGLGDVCDPEPSCVLGSVDGVLVIPPIDFEVTGFSVPEWTDRPIIPIVGGFLADGTPNTRTVYLNLVTGKFEDGPAFTASRGTDHAIAPYGLGYLTTTGAEIADGRQSGRFVELTDEQVVAGSYNSSLYDPSALSFTDSVLALVARSAESDSRVRLKYYDSANQVLVERYSFSLSTALDYYVMRDAQQRGFVYTDGRNLEQVGYLVNTTPETLGIITLDFPNDAADPFRPFMTPGAGDSAYVWERTTGTAYFAEPSTSSFFAQPSMDQVLEGTETHWVSFSNGPAFALVGKDNAGKLFAKVFSMACWPAANTADTDADGIFDFEDNCPFLSNVDQLDTDGNGTGDACSTDADGDGMVDVDDFILDDQNALVSLALDTDNDGQDNVDDADDDGDGIPDLEDRFPNDSDNDGFSNSIDQDDDGDGYTDFSEDILGGGSVNPLAFPGSGRLIWTAAGAATRVVEATDIGGDTVLPIALGTTPYLPRFLGRDNVYALDGVPGVTTKWNRLDVTTGVLVSYDFGAPLGGVDPIAASNGSEVAASILRDGRWDVVIGRVSPDFLLTLLNVGVEVRSIPDSSSGIVAFTGSPLGCTTCDLGYYTNLVDTIPVWPDKSEVELIRYDGQFLMIANGSLAPKVVWTMINGAVTELIAPGMLAVSSAVRSSAGHVFAVGEMESGSHEIWLFNVYVNKWFRVYTSSDTLDELDWTL